MLEHLTCNIEVFGLFHVVIISYWGIVALMDFWHWDMVIRRRILMDHGVINTLGSVFSTYLVNLWYLPTSHFIPRHFILDTFTLISIIPELDRYLLLANFTMTQDLLSRLRENLDQSLTFLVKLSYIFWALGSSFSMMERPTKLLIH